MTPEDGDGGRRWTSQRCVSTCLGTLAAVVLLVCASYRGSHPRPSSGLPLSLLMDDAGFGSLEGPYPDWKVANRARWMAGKEARIRFESLADNGCRNVLTLRALSGAPDQTLEVLANGQPVLFYRFQAPWEWHRLMSLPFRPQGDWNQLDFRAKRTTRDSSRELAILFDELSLNCE